MIVRQQCRRSQFFFQNSYGFSAKTVEIKMDIQINNAIYTMQFVVVHELIMQIKVCLGYAIRKMKEEYESVEL